MSLAVKNQRIALTPELAERYLNHVRSGLMDTEIERLPGMPARETVIRWRSNDPAFDHRVALARRQRADALAEKSVLVFDQEMPEGMDGARVNAWAQLVKGKSAALQWLAAKDNREHYGDNKTLEVSVKPLETLTLEQLMAIAAQGMPVIEGCAESVTDADETPE